MRLSELGENGLLELIREWTSGPARGVVLGVGDDAAVLESPGRDRQLVVSTDAWVNEVHFSRRWLAPDEIGHRAMAGSLSDLAAMGAEGFAAFVNLHAPPELEVEFVRSLFQGMDRVADSCGVAIVGGDCVRGELALGITVMGTVPAGAAMRRDGARPGDAVCVSGELGRSEAGRLILTGEANVEVPDQLRAVAVSGHRTPRPRFDVSKMLMKLERRSVDVDLQREDVRPVRPHAMMDVSDGLGVDLRRLCAASHVGCRVEAERIPVDGAARRIARAMGQPEWSLALGGGEDFELLFTVDPADVERVLEAARRALLTIAPIGSIVPAAQGLTLVGPDGKREQLPGSGWDHFKLEDRPGDRPPKLPPPPPLPPAPPAGQRGPRWRPR